MIRKFKLKNDEVWSEPYWVTIANEDDEDKVNDSDIYYYVEDDIDLSEVSIGDILELDEDFEVMGIDE